MWRHLRRFATCSHDKSLVVYCQEESGTWVKQGKLEYAGVVEAIAWATELTLLASVRDDNYIHYIDAATLQVATTQLAHSLYD
jgi:hypothetical protein